jgi:hypothetical protein
MSPLPKANSPTAHTSVSIVECGVLTIADYIFHENGTQEDHKCPVYAFYIEHKGLGKKAFFDLGVSKVLNPLRYLLSCGIC